MHGFMNRSKFAYILISIMNACVVREGGIGIALSTYNFIFSLNFSFLIFNILSKKWAGGTLIIEFNINLIKMLREKAGGGSPPPLSPINKLVMMIYCTNTGKM